MLTVAKIFHALANSFNKPVTEYVGNLKEILIYPVKSCSGYNVERARCLETGLEDVETGGKDRYFVVAVKDQSGRIQPLTQREEPKLSFVQAVYEKPARLKLEWKAADDNKGDTLVVDYGVFDQSVACHVLETAIWMTPFRGVDCGRQSSDWLNKLLSRNDLVLLYAAENIARVPGTHPKYGNDSFLAGAADLAPYLLCNMASVRLVNSWIADRCEPVPVVNYRPNVVVECADHLPFDEDHWQYICICKQRQQEQQELSADGIPIDQLAHCTELRTAKPCGRCRMTTVDLESGRFRRSGEPLRTLNKRRRLANGRYEKSGLFGVNLKLDLVSKYSRRDCPCQRKAESVNYCNMISVGDSVHVVRHQNLYDVLMTA